jgi:UDP-N-acetylglucosamine 4,6-dehydratase (inverting)|tara:strand:- start:1650 stop:2657 length:1008 start_codon:yes stop_codon:yes gene_type:complete
MFKNKTILITGGTGSFGKAFLKYLLINHKDIKKIIIFSRDELKQFELSTQFSEKKYPNIRYFLGDIRDKDRLDRAMEGVDYVIHAAALKQVPAAEYNPFEVIKTNVIGAQNIIEACLNTNVKKVIALSTDKACAPINLYGATKLCSDKLFISANNIVGKRKLSFSVVRYGNVMGSRGSVIPEFFKQKKSGSINITNKNMTRFNITMQQSIDLVIWSLNNSIGGEIFVPKIPSYKILDLAKTIAPEAKINIIGTRPGEKIHEELITESESGNAVELKKYFVILTSLITDSNGKALKNYWNSKKNKKIKKEFSYKSNTNNDFLSVENIKKLIKGMNY